MFNIADCTAHVAMVFLYTFGLLCMSLWYSYTHLYPKAVAILAAFLRFTNISLNTNTVTTLTVFVFFIIMLAYQISIYREQFRFGISSAA